MASLSTLSSEKLDNVLSMLGKIVEVIKSPEHGEDDVKSIMCKKLKSIMHERSDTSVSICMIGQTNGNGYGLKKPVDFDFTWREIVAGDLSFTIKKGMIHYDSSNDGVSQHEPEPLTEQQLASASPDQQKNMIGERLYPLINVVQPDLAGKITGMLLEMDNSDLLVLLNAPDALNSKIQEAIDVLADYAADEDDGNGTNETNSVGAATSAAASPATDHGEEEHKESDAEASAKELAKEVATSVLSSDGTDAEEHKESDAGAAGNRKWVKAASQDPTEEAVWQIASAKKKREMTENARKLKAAAAEAREKCKSKRQGYDAMRKPCPGQFEGCLKFRWRDPITRETMALCCACHHENMRQERQRQQQLKEEWYTAHYRCPCPCPEGKDGCMEWRFYDRDQDVVLPLCQVCSR